MKLSTLHIEGIGGLEKLNLSFNPHVNIICGPNGIGKSTILECISQFFTARPNEFLKKKADHDSGFAELTTDTSEVFRLKRTNFHPNETAGMQLGSGGTEYAQYVIYIKTSRSFDYIPLKAVGSDSITDPRNAILSGMSATDAKNWFVNRYLWSAHPDSITEAQRHNLEIAKNVFSATDSNITFSRVKAGTYDILLNQNDGTEIYYEYLSSGYKSLIYIFLGLIKEIEHRFSNDNLIIEDFDGVILIDELDLHLHPQWQSSVLTVLSALFPKAQFITTTHSAHVIQSAESNQIITLGRKKTGEVYTRELPTNLFGYKGWTVEEILTDVMGLEETRSPLFVEAMERFELALDKENFKDAQNAYNTLNEMLHPGNTLKKLLKIQLASLGE
ncbi:putative ATP-binding protein involved in virulence [Paenibacillus sp. 4624]|uniref:AAA family ATPase n=1 Tax=Paenibacillus sp. 4624 TaxID=3156453 RepID=UPI003D1BEA52